ncbi:MAG TPA: hypothetical protein VGR90_06385, partial [Acidimicrobiales bacterium]|nr:hypothetical protein [Acidimicrobiales bacterium]
RTPIGHLFYDIPLYGGQRLQARNLGVVDLALAVLFAYWVDRFLIVPARRTARALALLAPGVVLAMIGLGLGWPGGLAHWMKSPTEVFPRTWPFSVVAGGLAVAVIAIVLLGHRWRRRVRARAVVLVTLVDVAFFFANAAYGFAATSALATGSPAAGNLGAGSREVAQMLPPGTRYLVADPSVVYSGYTNVGAGLAPVPDFNVLGALPSVQGYGSLVSDGYEAATGAHDQGAVLPQMVGGDLADRLQLGLVLVATSDPLVGGLRPALTAPRWEPVGQVDGLAAWRNTNVLPPAYLAPGPGTTSAASGGTAADGSATFLVDTTTASTLVRSEAYSPGWKATLRPAPGPGSGAARGVRDETVTAAGILQGAALPAGRWLVTFHYHPDRAYLGIELGLLGALLCLLTAGGPALLGTLRRTYRNSLRDALERALPRRLSPPARPPTSGAGRRPAR